MSEYSFWTNTIELNEHYPFFFPFIASWVAILIALFTLSIIWIKNANSLIDEMNKKLDEYHKMPKKTEGWDG